MRTVDVLVIQPISDADLAQIAALDPRLHVLDGRGMFETEYSETWPEWSVQRYVTGRWTPPGQCDRLATRLLARMPYAD